MKRTLLLLLLATSVSASESFVLDIPIRSITNQETGKVLVTLTLNSASAGSQLVVNGATTLNLGDTQMVAGDQVTFSAGSGNDVKIVYVPLSNFSGDFCQGAGAVTKDIPMRFVGAQDVVSYRVSSYIVAAPSAECSQVSKRTGDTPANIQLIGDGVAPVLSATFLGRHPFDVALVLDKSGSMADIPPGANPGPQQPTKADILKSAMDTFVAQWMQLDSAMPSGPEWSHDRIGVVQFDSTAQSQTLPGADAPANFFLKRGNASAWNAVGTNINTLTPGLNTSIGDGINAAMQQWKNDPQNDFQIIVVTDGMQNTAPLIQPTGSGFLGLQPVAGLPQELRERFIPIHSIGFGTPAAVDATLLTNLAFETAGVSFISINATTMFNALGMTLVAILKGNTASLALQQNSTFNGSGPAALVPVVVDRSVQRAVFCVQWAPPVTNDLDLDIFPPGAASPATPTSQTKTPQSSLKTFDMTHRGDVGTWQVRVKRARDAKTVTLPYTLSVFYLEQYLDYQFSFDTVHTATGDSIRLRALMAYGGHPLTNLPPDAIRVRIQRPQDGLGNILRKIPVSPKIPVSSDPQTAYQAKLDFAALSNPHIFDLIVPSDFVTVSMQEDGNGVYSTVFDNTAIPGAYAFNVTLDWNDDRTGQVHREERLEDTVKVRIDPVRSTVDTVRNGTTATVTVTPRDSFGNYLGPGYASLVKVRVVGVEREIPPTPVDPDLTGTYTVTLRDVPLDAQILVSVDGVLLGRARD